MDKIPAACAMDWSIRLEKSLRSGKPGQSIEAIQQLASWLEWWNGDSELSSSACRIFDLIPCEDKLFLNAIFLRLIEAFRLGDKHIKSCIVALFSRMRKKRRLRDGILDKAKLENYLHLLRKVKQVFDDGDVEEKTLALTLFGCWADLVKDCADVRYIVLSSFVSSDVLEMKAGLFAAGCLCELSDHFAFVFLDVLATAFLAESISRDIKLAGAKLFSKLCRSFSLADKTYKIGLKLLMYSTEDDFSTVMLTSLTKIASMWMLLLPAQIELLALFLSEEKSLQLQVASLKCHQLVLAKGSCCLLSTPETHTKLVGVLNRLELHSLQLQALRILHKILQFTLFTSPFEEITETFHKLLVVATDMLKSSIISIRVLPIDIIADLCGKVLGKAEVTPVEAADSLAFFIISFILDRVLQLVTAHVDIQKAESSTEIEVKSLLYSLFNLVGKHPRVPFMLLKNISLFIINFVKRLDKMTVVGQNGLSNQKVIEFDAQDKALVESNALVDLSKILAACVQALEEADAETLQALDVLKLQAENVCHCGHFGSYTCLTYVLLSHQLGSIIEKFGFKSRKSSAPSVDSVLLLDECALGFANKMLAKNSYWSSYQAGRSAACQGAWSTAAFVFARLTTKVQSPLCSAWLEFLSLFSASERQLQLFILPDLDTCVVHSGSHVTESVSFSFGTNHQYYMENLLRASHSLLTAKKILVASDVRHRFCFQIWFSALRGKVLKAIADVIKLLGEIAFGQDVPGGQLVGKKSLSCSLIHSPIEVSLQMYGLAKEFDLLLTTFMGMDMRSRMIISGHALSCSIMAFTVSFAFIVPDFNRPGNVGLCVDGNQQVQVLILFIEDLMGRMKRTNSESGRKLLFLLKSINKDWNCFLPRSRSKISCVCYDAVALSKLCEYSIEEIFNMRTETDRMDCGGSTSQQVKNSSHLLSNVISEMILTPFRTPEHLFRVRSAVFSELFVMNDDGKAVHGTSLPSRTQLSLNLCFQMKNFAGVLPNGVHLILTCQEQSQEMIGSGNSETEAKMSCEGEQIDDMMELNEKLWNYVIGNSACHSSTVNQYVRFELNERGQGFCTCMLDVSSLRPGCYRIKWQSGCIDTEGSYWSLLPENSGPLFTILSKITM